MAIRFNESRCALPRLLALLAALSLLLATSAQQPNDSCGAGADNTFRMRVDLFASTFGEYTVDGCDGLSPTLQLEPGVTYTFAQADVTNIGHPLGFAYAQDGRHAGAPELASPPPRACAARAWRCEPGVAQQAPLFITDGVAAVPGGSNDTTTWARARDAYELAFQAPEAAWAAHAYSVQLTIPVGSRTASLFYFSALFPGASGLINIRHPPSTPQTSLNALPAPFVPAAYYERLRSPSADLDLTCGTRGLGDARGGGMMGGGMMGGGMMGGGMMRGGGMMGGGASGSSTSACGNDTAVGQFNVCMQAIERAMMMGGGMPMMMMQGRCEDPIVLFVNQMLPHHEGAVNMAKAALKLGGGAPGFAAMAALLRNVVNTQNAQVLEMRAWQQQQNATSSAATQGGVQGGAAPGSGR